MGIANCGGLVLDADTLVLSNKIITTTGSTATNGIIANCGGVLFDSAVFKKVGTVITDINADESSINPMVVGQQGCGGLVVDANYFELNSDGELTLDSTPVREVDQFKFTFIDQDTSDIVDLHGGWTLSAGTVTLTDDGETVWTKNFANGVIGTDGRVTFAVTDIDLGADMILTLANVAATKGTQTMSAGALVDLTYEEMVDVYYSGSVEPEIEVTITTSEE